MGLALKGLEIDWQNIQQKTVFETKSVMLHDMHSKSLVDIVSLQKITAESRSERLNETWTFQH